MCRFAATDSQTSCSHQGHDGDAKVAINTQVCCCTFQNDRALEF
jgi:hypothetical protein